MIMLQHAATNTVCQPLLQAGLHECSLNKQRAALGKTSGRTQAFSEWVRVQDRLQCLTFLNGGQLLCRLH